MGGWFFITISNFLDTSVVAKAKSARKAVVKGSNNKMTKKVYTTSTFRLPKTLRLTRAPKYVRTPCAKRGDKMDAHTILKCPMKSEKAMREIELRNTLVFLCDVRANKSQIKEAAKTLYGLEAKHVNTLIRPDGQKKAYIRLSPEDDAMDAAGRIGFV